MLITHSHCWCCSMRTCTCTPLYTNLTSFVWQEVVGGLDCQRRSDACVICGDIRHFHGEWISGWNPRCHGKARNNSVGNLAVLFSKHFGAWHCASMFFFVIWSDYLLSDLLYACSIYYTCTCTWMHPKSSSTWMHVAYMSWISDMICFVCQRQGPLGPVIRQALGSHWTVHCWHLVRICTLQNKAENQHSQGV